MGDGRREKEEQHQTDIKRKSIEGKTAGQAVAHLWRKEAGAKFAEKAVTCKFASQQDAGIRKGPPPPSLTQSH